MRSRVAAKLGELAVPLLFAAICIAGIASSERSVRFFAFDALERYVRNAFIVLSLVIPIVAGLGLNFGIVLGAMCGQAAIIVVENAEVSGLAGLGLAASIAVPLSIVVGVLVGITMNAARGREMIAGLILGYFANGIYQLIFLMLAGPVIPFTSPRLLLPGGTGIRNTVDLTAIGQPLSRTAILTGIAVAAASIFWFLRTKLGQDLRSVGQDQHVAGTLGIDVDRNRIIAMVISTVLGGLGMILFVLDLGTLNTTTAHEQVGFYAIAAILVGGATVARASIWHALLGTLLFHASTTVLTQVSQERLGSPQIGEYLREVAAYSIIAVTLAIHAYKSRKPR